MSSRKTFEADIASGLNGCNFGLSPCVDSIRYNNRYNPVRFPFWAFTSNGEFGREWIREDEYRQEAERVWRLAQGPGGLKKFSDLLSGNIRRAEELKKHVWNILPALKELDQEHLLSAYNRFIRKYNLYFGLGVLTFVYESALSEKFLTLLSDNGRSVSSLDAALKNRYRSFMIDSEKELIAIKREKDKDRREKLITRYIEDFYFIETDYHVAPIIDRQHVRDKIRRISAKKPKSKPRSKVRLNVEESRIVKLLQLTEALRDTRKKTNQVGLYGLFRFLDEASRRAKLPLRLCRRAFWFEYRDLLEKPNLMAKTLRKRPLASLVFDRGKCFYLSYAALKERKAVVFDTVLRGVPASPGRKKGLARVVLGRNHFSKVKKGDILVSTMTRPEFLPVMKKAGAIITEEGGITSHAAVVARELRIPCLVGIKNLTRLIKDNDRIEVNAIKGLVNKLGR